MLRQRVVREAGKEVSSLPTVKCTEKRSIRNTKTLPEKCPMPMRNVFGFELRDLTSWSRFVRLLFRPTDPASLGVTRALFGLLMVLDIPEERGLSDADVKWGDPNECRFPLFNVLRPLPLEWMCVIYLVMWIGAIGMMLGLRFRLSCVAFVLPYWYILLLDKSVWNNHSYLYGLVSILLLGSHAHHFWSLDGARNRAPKNAHVPLWNYTILRYQFFILYFIAGLKKLDSEWLGGYSMTNLSKHWVFEPFRLILTPDQIDYWIIHLGGFFLDLTVGFWLFFDLTRPYAMFFCASFHLMNSRMFAIGMFPYVCLATMPVFCNADWPRTFQRWVEERLKWFSCLPVRNMRFPWRSDIPLQKASCCIYPRSGNGKKGKDQEEGPPLSLKHHLIAALLVTHMGLQVFLPYSHFITKGYNNWTNGLYGYSWDMMVHSWDTILVVVKIVDKNTGTEHFLDPEAWVQTDRWTKHADMAVQYVSCVGERVKEAAKSTSLGIDSKKAKMDNLSSLAVHVDVWSSLNGRFQQRIFDPRTDILAVADQWSPFKPVPWVMPLLDDKPSPNEKGSGWRRGRMKELIAEVHSWSPYSDVLFVADFPGLVLENYLNSDFGNVTLTVLAGQVVFEVRSPSTSLEDTESTHHQTKFLQKNQNDGPSEYAFLKNITLNTGDSILVPTSTFHYVYTISSNPSFYMYSYINKTRESLGLDDENVLEERRAEDASFLEEAQFRVSNFLRALGLVGNSILKLLYSVPMMRRVRVG
ncbi:vitamin K-dependent gamma-carboxylase [Ischnura elegans]|uniref:vitamin K-dependent gamma-carboxylase n=1 Tax=Ischnura elegans TaxID=197161 RepID=UPI001ED8BF6C|nr:vitamin K-dependent gamma-carboxylase [Ischnura elegans]